MRYFVSFLIVVLLLSCESVDYIFSTNSTDINLPNYNLLRPVVKTLPITNIDYTNSKVTLNGELLNLGFYNDRYLTNQTGFQIWSTKDNDTLTVFTQNCELGMFSYLFENWIFESPIEYRAIAAMDSTILSKGEIQYVNGLFIDIPVAAISVHTQDIASGTWVDVDNGCRNSTVGGYSDWRLPSIDELYILYSLQLKIGGFAPDYYWSMDFADTYHKYSIHFKDGFLSTSDGHHLGRCIRNL